MSDVERILLIDDDEDDFVLVRELLSEAFGGARMLDWASSWDDGLEAIGRRAHHVYLVDYRLGERDGLELAREAVAAGCPAPIILLTGQGSREIDLEATEAGAADYLVKGEITAPLLERAIRYALAHQQFLRSELEANEALRKTNEKLTQFYRTAHQFVDNVSHEFRTPLTVIREFASILQDGLTGDMNDEQQEYIGIIVSRVDDLTFMINDMLDISKLEAGLLGVSRKGCQVAEIIRHVKPTLDRKAAASRCGFDVSIDRGLPQIYCDPEKIGRVILNFAVNAFKFAGEGGHTTLWVRHRPDRSEVVFGLTDNGPGIAPENLMAIFERFRQVGGNARASTKGFGLGLNIAKELAHLNLGEIFVESELGQGSTFGLTAPVADPPEVLGRLLRRPELLRDGSTFVSLIFATVGLPEDAPLLEEVERFLQYHLRASDLLFRTRQNAWVIAAPSIEQGGPGMRDRLEMAHSEANRNRPGDALPAIILDVGGTWRISDQAGELIDYFRDVFGVHAACHG